MFVLLTGNIGAGKSTLLKKLEDVGFARVIEYTTRPMREHETDGVDYHFVTDEVYDRMEAAGEFAESQHVNTIYGPWKYGAKKTDMDGNRVFVVGVRGAEQILGAGIPVLSVMLDIDRDLAMNRALGRGDDRAEFERRFDKDQPRLDKLRPRVSMVLNAAKSPEVIFRAIDSRIALERSKLMNIHRYTHKVGDQTVVTSQPMTKEDVALYLEDRPGDRHMKPYLRMKENGMPAGKVNQIAWLLLQMDGCGFCKVCRDEPCDIKDGEKCTNNIADYIRKIVHEEDAGNAQM